MIFFDHFGKPKVRKKYEARSTCRLLMMMPSPSLMIDNTRLSGVRDQALNHLT